MVFLAVVGVTAGTLTALSADRRLAISTVCIITGWIALYSATRTGEGWTPLAAMSLVYLAYSVGMARVQNHQILRELRATYLLEKRGKELEDRHQGGRGGQRGQEPFPGQHEPRGADTNKRCSGHG